MKKNLKERFLPLSSSNAFAFSYATSVDKRGFTVTKQQDRCIAGAVPTQK